jgi:hypothetical protein
MNNTCHIAVGRAFVPSSETLTVGINNQVAIATDATGSQTRHVVVIVDEPSNAELTAAAEQLFGMLDQEEDGNASSR